MSRRPIRMLDDLSVARIAAGEVVERPASVVKELVENALDAGARHIDVRIDGGGLRRIQVTDDGGGIAADEVTLAFARHATSKISDAAELESVRSLGFRGEALASIAAVSHVTVVSRTAGAELGVRVRIDNGRLLAQEPANATAGTRMEVENLFNAVPARLKFQKSEATEAGRVAEWLGRLAFAHPHVAFTLTRGDRTTLRTSGDGDRRAVLAAVLGADIAADLLDVDAAGGDVTVVGLAGAPHVQRANRTGIALFAGGRWIQSPRLTHAVVEAYHGLIPNGRYPIAWLMIEVAPDTIDINVHPAKTEVRFRHEGEVWQAVQRAVRAAVTGLAPIAPARSSFGALSGRGDRPSPAAPPTAAAEAAWPWAVSGGSSVRPSGGWAGASRIAESSPPTAESPASHDVRAGEPGPAAPSPHPALPPLRVVGHIAATYLVAEGPDGLYLIDQHAAHERIMYERYMARAGHGGVPTQALMEPHVVPLDAAQRAWFEDNGPALALAGLTVELHGPDAVAVSAVPEVLAGDDPSAVVRAIVDGGMEDTQIVERSLEARLIRAVCKRATVKAGQILTDAEARALLRDLEQCQAPHTCPHGRPTLIVLTHARLAQLFGRA